MSRWIYVPLIVILLYILQAVLTMGSTDATELLIAVIFAAVFAFFMLHWSGSKARELSGRDDEEIYKVKQHRQLTVLLNYEKTFEICGEAIASLNPAKIKIADAKQGIIKFRTPVKWDSFGHHITVNLKKINENLTEIEVETKPVQKILLVSNGQSWKYVEDFCNLLKEKDAEINQKVLVESTAILDDVYVKPFQKEKVER